jgi:hypothetical protein
MRFGIQPCVIDADLECDFDRAFATLATARGAFNAAVRCYPSRRWMLLWGSYIVERYDPPKVAS